MSQSTRSVKYRSFLLRLWLENDSQTWRFSLEDPHTGERRGLANLETLTTFLKEVTEQTKHDGRTDQSSA